MKYIHKDIEGFEGLYQISTSLRIRSLMNGTKPRKRLFLLKPRLVGKPGQQYHGVILYKDQQKYAFKLHYLLAKAFVPGYAPGLEVNHMDGNGLNNTLNNLEWTTHKDNVLHARRVLRRGGSKQVPIKLTKDGKEHSFGSIGEAADKLNLNAASLRNRVIEKAPFYKGYKLEKI